MKKIFLAILAGFMMISVTHAADTIKDVSGARGSRQAVEQLPAGALQQGELLLFKNGIVFNGSNVNSPENAASRAIEINDSLLRTMANRPVPLPRSLLPRQRNSLNSIAQLAKQGNHPAVAQRWGEFMSDLATGGIPVDINSLIQFVLREAYLETNKDLQFYAEKVQYYNKIKKDLAGHLRGVRKLAARMGSYDPRKTAEVNAIVSLPPPYRPGASQRTLEPKLQMAITRMSQNQLHQYIKSTEERHRALSNNTDLDLKKYLSKRQQLTKRISSTSRVLFDTAIKIASIVNLQARIREEINYLRGYSTDGSIAWPAEITYHDVRVGSGGVLILVEITKTFTNKQEVQNKIEQLEEVLMTITY